MNIEFMKDFFLYGFLINFGILLWWFAFLLLAPDWVYGIHKRMVGITREQFNGSHYNMMGFYKLTNFLFFGVPYIALCLAS